MGDRPDAQPRPRLSPFDRGRTARRRRGERGRRSATRDGSDYLDAAGGAIVVNVGHGRARSPQSMARPGRPPRVRPRQRLHHRALEAYAAEVGRCFRRRPGDLPGSGGSEAIETALKLARAYHLARGEPDRRSSDRAVGELPRQHARRARPVRAPAAPPPVRAWLGRFRHVSAAYPYRAGDPARTHSATRAGARRRAGRDLRRRGSGTRRRLRRRADRRRHARRGRAARRLLAGGRRGLPRATASC